MKIILVLSTLLVGATSLFSQGICELNFDSYFSYEIDCADNTISINRTDAELPFDIPSLRDLLLDCCNERERVCRTKCCIPVLGDLPEPGCEDVNSLECQLLCRKGFKDCFIQSDTADFPRPVIRVAYEERSRSATVPHQFDNVSGSLTNGIKYIEDNNLDPAAVTASFPLRQSRFASQTACEGYLNYPDGPYLSPCSTFKLTVDVSFPVLDEESCAYAKGVKIYRFAIDAGVQCAF